MREGFGRDRPRTVRPGCATTYESRYNLVSSYYPSTSVGRARITVLPGYADATWRVPSVPRYPPIAPVRAELSVPSASSDAGTSPSRYDTRIPRNAQIAPAA